MHPVFHITASGQHQHRQVFPTGPQPRQHLETVDVLHDGVAADLALSSEEYAVAILDVGLPRMDGFEVLARLR